MLAPDDIRPVVFLAFKHNRPVSQVAKKLRDDLEAWWVFAYRAMDDPHPGWSLQKRLDRWIERADGVVILWSQQGSESPAVNLEYQTAKRLGRRICLVRFQNVKVPDDWTGEEWLELKGVTFGVLGAGFWKPDWTNFVAVVAKFAKEAKAERTSSNPTPA